MTSANEILEWLCSPEPTANAPRVAVILAHPDDEAIGAGSRLPRLRESLFVHVTDGAPKDLEDVKRLGFLDCRSYSTARRRELEAVLAHCGHSGPIIQLNIPDQEAALSLCLLTNELIAIVRQFRPDAIITHAFEGGHPDHDATALAVHQACRAVEIQFGPAPLILEMAEYNGSSGYFQAIQFLPFPGCTVRTVHLSNMERDLKKRLFQLYATQSLVLEGFPTTMERFRQAPTYDFLSRPHPGPLYYEEWRWGNMTWERWTELVAQATHAREGAVA